METTVSDFFKLTTIEEAKEPIIKLYGKSRKEYLADALILVFSVLLALMLNEL